MSLPSKPPTAPGGVNALVDEAARLLATDPAAAERQVRAALKLAPKDPRGGLILASSLRRQGQVKAALAILEPLARAYPKAALTHYELGVCLAADGRTGAAAASLRHAVSVNRDLAEAWRELGGVLFRIGDMAGSQAAYDQTARLSVRDPRLKPAADALYGGDLSQAEVMLRRHIEASPKDAAALRLLAEAFNRQGRSIDAERVLALALEIEPDHTGGMLSYAAALFRRQNAALALPVIERLLQISPNEAAYRNLMAGTLSLVGRDDEMIALYGELVRDYPEQPRVWLNYGHALRTVGRRDDAVAAYRRCIALEPGMGDAYWGLANLKVASFAEEDAKAMAVQLRRKDLIPEDRINLHFALGKALEDRKDYEEAFAQYQAGAEIRRRETPYDAEETQRLTRTAKQVFTPDFLAARSGAGVSTPDPIFIVGLPRSGSTLVEQILASHSAVQGTMELPTMGLITLDLDWDSRQTGGPPYPDLVADLPPARFAALGQRYIDETRLYRTEGTPYFIDKMPNNFSHVGLIHLMMPKARIIDARRHPMGACFSAFKQHFAQGQNFSYDLTDLGRYYADYVDLMAHFDAVLPGRVHRVIYEDMVEDTEGVVRRLLDYCGLPFEEGCLRFYDNRRAVRTVSSEQVRRPIFRDGLDQWRRFEPWLGPLEAALGPALETWRI